jgi:endonuclease/exonuclease/phosphatase family metal-dependent hydrolase
MSCRRSLGCQRSRRSRSPIRIAAIALPAIALATTGVATAQIRVASYNTATAFEDGGTPRAGLQNVLAGIGTESFNGISKRIDLLALTEQNNTTGNTTAQVLSMMNTLYGAGTYAKGTFVSDGSINPNTDSSALIYDTTKFTLVAEKLVGTASGSGQPRQEIRYQLRPISYTSSSDFYVYVAHYKALGDSTSQNRRNIEAQAMRADANTLPAGSRILYVGDFNLTEGTSETAWSTITAAGNTQGIDPMNGSWANNALTWSTTNLGSRLDFQFQTPPTNDGHGFSLINGSYHPFTNNGSIASGGQSPNSFVRSASDHYPVVADYRYPAKMSMSVGSVPATVIVGASVPVNVTITNTAPVNIASGADGLDYTVSGNGSLSGSGVGTNVLATSAGNVHTLAMNTSSVGTRSGTVTANSSSQEVGNGTLTQNVSTNVIDHAHPSISVGSIDFGVRGRGLGVATASFFIANTLGGVGATAGLDLDSIGASGSTGALTTTAVTFANLAAGAGTSSRQTFVATLSDAGNGTFSATYAFNVSDQNLPGATSLGTLSLTLSGIVATPGDANLDGVISFDDYVRIDLGFNNQSSGWSNGDFNGDGAVNFDDYVLIDLNFNQQLGTLSRALDWISGDDRSESGRAPTGVEVVIDHFEQFGAEYGRVFLAAVPEPGAVTVVGALGLLIVRRRRPQPRFQPPIFLR